MKRIAALQMLVNTIDPIILSTTFGRRIAFHKSNTRRGFSSTIMSGRAYACRLLRRYRLRSLSQFLILGGFV
jgi:hypothetical protein